MKESDKEACPKTKKTSQTMVELRQVGVSGETPFKEKMTKRRRRFEDTSSEYMNCKLS